jgi:hypothetical protein
MYQVIKRAQWFTSGILFAAVATGYYIYGLGFFAKVKFQWWVWTAEWSDLLKFNF